MKLGEMLRAFASENKFNFSENGSVSTPIGNNYVFVQNKQNIMIVCQNLTVDHDIDPNGHTGVPPPSFDQSHFQILFFSSIDDTKEVLPYFNALMSELSTIAQISSAPQ